MRAAPIFVADPVKAHVLGFYATIRPASPMSWGAWILLAIYPATLLPGLEQATDAELAKA